MPAVVLDVQSDANFLINANSSTAVGRHGARAFGHDADRPVLDQFVVLGIRDAQQEVHVVRLVRPHGRHAPHEGQVRRGAAWVLEA